MLLIPVVWEAALVLTGGLPWHISHIVFGMAVQALGLLRAPSPHRTP
jgi:hypothetical protein